MQHDEEEPREPTPDPPPGPPPPELAPHGLFERVNNYGLLLYAVVCLLMNWAIGGMLQVVGHTVLSLAVPGVFSVLIPFYLLTRRSPYGFTGEFFLRPPPVRTAALVVVIAASAILPVDALAWFFAKAWKPNANYTSFILSIKPKGPLSFAEVALGTVIVAPLAEELLFRGFVQRILMRNMRAPLAILLAGVAFGAFHFNPSALVGIAVLGMLYGYLFYRSRSLLSAIAGHAIYNLVVLIQLTISTEEEIVSAPLVSPDPARTLLSLAICIAALWLLERERRLSAGR